MFSVAPRTVATGYKGSLWTGAVTEDGAILVGGLRGTLYRSADQGANWSAISSGAKSSLTDIATRGQDVVAVGLDGSVSLSSDQGLTFKSVQREDRLPLTAVVAADKNHWQMFSEHGVLDQAR